MNIKPKILIVDDDRIICQSLKLLFSLNGFETTYIINPLNVIEFTESFQPDLIVLDMNFDLETTGEEGLKILQRLKSAFPDLPIVLITAWGTLELAVSGMKAGASDFLTKPWENEEMLKTVQNQLKLKENRTRENEKSLSFLTGDSDFVKNLRSTIHRLAESHVPILITGAEGTGKEFLAEQIHDLSPQKNEEFTKADFFGWDAEQFKKELLGFSRGAYKEALQAKSGLFGKNGTLYFSHLDLMPLDFQFSFLKILQEKIFKPVGGQTDLKFNARLMVSSTQNLAERILQNQFREDLYFKLALAQIHLPKLSDRREDIPALTQSFVKNTKKTINDSALEWLSIQDFPGNISELRFWIERTCHLSQAKKITIKELKKFQTKSPKAEATTLEEMEKSMIEKAISQKKGNMAEVAKKLGITRSSLYRRMSKFGITNTETNED